MKKILGEKSSRVESATLAATEVTPDVSTNSQDYPNNQRKRNPQRNPQRNQRRNPQRNQRRNQRRNQLPLDVNTEGDANYYRDLLLTEFDEILVDELPNELPPLRDINHRIPYKPKTPWAASKYRLPEAHKLALEQDVKPKLRSGILRYSSDVPLAASHMVPKKVGLRHVQDLHK